MQGMGLTLSMHARTYFGDLVDFHRQRERAGAAEKDSDEWRRKSEAGESRYEMPFVVFRRFIIRSTNIIHTAPLG